MKTELKKKNKTSLALYIVAVLFGIYAIFSLINTALYISNLISTQYITVSESLTDIIVYFVTNCGPYIFYAAALGGMGYLVEMTAGPRKAKAAADENQTEVNAAEVTPDAGLSAAVETTVTETIVDAAAPEEDRTEEPTASGEAEAKPEADSDEKEKRDKKASELSDMEKAI